MPLNQAVCWLYHNVHEYRTQQLKEYPSYKVVLVAAVVIVFLNATIYCFVTNF